MSQKTKAWNEMGNAEARKAKAKREHNKAMPVPGLRTSPERLQRDVASFDAMCATRPMRPPGGKR